jgi:hypothetical protein
MRQWEPFRAKEAVTTPLALNRYGRHRMTQLLVFQREQALSGQSNTSMQPALAFGVHLIIIAAQ